MRLVRLIEGRLTMKINSVKSVRDEVLKAYYTAKAADDNWQEELDACGIYRYSKAARGVAGSNLRELYEAKVAADVRQAELTEIMWRYQDPKQVIA
jgi:hypothetical protein